MSIKKASIAAVLAAAMAVSSAAVAQQTQETGWYVGAAFGQAKSDLDCTGTTSCDDSDSSWKIFGGYQINRNFAVEFGYANLGEAKASTPAFFFGGLLIPAANVSIEATVWELVGVGSLPVADRFSLYGKIGLYRSETDISVAFPSVGATSNDSDDNMDITFGFGARYDFTRNFGIRAEWQRYSSVSAGDFGDSDVDVMSVGLLWRF